MAQGKEYTKEQREIIIQSLQPYLEMGFSRNKACEFIGLPPQTLSNWVQQDESLGIKLTGWENVITSLAISNIKQAVEKESEMEDNIKVTSKWWLERKVKDFSPKQDVTTDGEKITGITVTYIENATQPNSDTSTEEDSIS
jgi:hypothetical protein